MTEAKTLVRPGMTPSERSRYVADQIESHPGNFDMAWYVRVNGAEAVFSVLGSGWRPTFDEPPFEAAGETECGTACCLAGWALAVTPPEEVDSAGGSSLDGTAAELLGISYFEGKRIFYDFDLTPASAAAYLRENADRLDAEAVE